jgi:hypothetical protein
VGHGKNILWPSITSGCNQNRASSTPVSEGKVTRKPVPEAILGLSVHPFGSVDHLLGVAKTPSVGRVVVLLR